MNRADSNRLIKREVFTELPMLVRSVLNRYSNDTCTAVLAVARRASKIKLNQVFKVSPRTPKRSLMQDRQRRNVAQVAN